MLFTKNKKEKIQEFLQSLGAEKISHTKGSSFFAHLVRVSEILESWDLEEYVVHAGMCHSLYSTEVFHTALLTPERRDELRSIVGEKAEKLVFHFCAMRRASFKKKVNGQYAFDTSTAAGEMEVNKLEASALLHLLLANDIDHLNPFNVHEMSPMFTARYQPFVELLSEKAAYFVSGISAHPSRIVSPGGDFVRFVGHAGVQVSVGGTSLVIDPWLYSSNREQPLLQGLDPASRTIDFQMPDPRNTIEELRSDIILLSHFHTHHAPLREIAALADMQLVQIVCPPLDADKLLRIKDVLGGKIFDSITFHFITEDTQLEFGDIRVRGMTHGAPQHLAYFVETLKGSVLHIADAKASSSGSPTFGPMWEKFYGLKPDFAFLSCPGHQLRTLLPSGERAIDEKQTLTPTQAAKLAVMLGAKNAGPIGVYNHSIWTDHIEYSRTADEAEREFYWALSFLAPSIRILTLRPGDIFVL